MERMFGATRDASADAHTARLDAAGALYFFTTDPNGGFYDDRVERISVGAGRAVVYQESGTKKVKIHGSQLVSGY